MAYDQTTSPAGARDVETPHHHDRSAAGISRSFADAGRDIPDGMAEALAERIARAGGWSAAYSETSGKVGFSGWSTEDRWLHELPIAESDADNPATALACLLPVLSREPAFLRASRLLARIEGGSVAQAQARLREWVSTKTDRAA